MKLTEMGFPGAEDRGLDFDVVDDLIVYMRNDPEFYRREYYPVLAAMSDQYKSEKRISRGGLEQLVDQAIPRYMKKYKINRIPNEVFTDEDKRRCTEMIFAEELPEIKKGEY